MKSGVSKKLRDSLAKNHACYVLITCGEPKPDGQMDVEMAYDGDPVLAAYLLQSAQSYIDEIDEEEEWDLPVDSNFRQIN